MPVTMRHAGLLLSLVILLLAMLAWEATCAHGMVVDKDSLLSKDVADDTDSDILEKEAIYRLLQSRYSPKDYPSFSTNGVSDYLSNQLLPRNKKGSLRAIDHMEDRLQYLTWCRTMKITNCRI